MSDLTAAILIIPFLTALVLVLECSRLGCTRLFGQRRKLSVEQAEPSLNA